MEPIHKNVTMQTTSEDYGQDWLVKDGKTLKELGEDEIKLKYLEKCYKSMRRAERQGKAQGIEGINVNEKYKYVFLLTSSGNIDRLAGFSMSIPKGKYFIVDEFQNELLDIVNKENRACGYEFKKKTVYGKNLTESFATRGFGMVVRANGNFQKLVEKYASEYPKDTCLIYSLWSGYKTMPNIEAMLGVIENVFFLHSSGHIVGEDFVEMLENVNPRKVLVIHTEKANIELNCGAEIVSLEDEEVFEL